MDCWLSPARPLTAAPAVSHQREHTSETSLMRLSLDRRLQREREVGYSLLLQCTPWPAPHCHPTRGSKSPESPWGPFSGSFDLAGTCLCTNMSTYMYTFTPDLEQKSCHRCTHTHSCLDSYTLNEHEHVCTTFTHVHSESKSGFSPKKTLRQRFGCKSLIWDRRKHSAEDRRQGRCVNE